MPHLSDLNEMRLVEKPSRYLNGEWNSSHKRIEGPHVRFALAFPDCYEIAQSCLGLKILYNIAKNHPKTVVERVYAPLPDMEGFLKEKNIPLSGLESGTPIGDFDVLGFTLQYQMTFTNILQMLSLSRIPIHQKDRDKSHPIVIGGGPGAFNPEPVADFFDAFLIGDGEEALPEILELIYSWKNSGKRDRGELLKSLSAIDGIYIPSLYQIEYEAEGRNTRITAKTPWAPKTVKKRFVKDLNKVPFPSDPIVPYVQTIHDRVMLEIFRGCGRGCRFCQAGFIYRPVRERTAESLIKTAIESVENTGYDEISLLSLSSTDYGCISPLMEKLSERFSGERVSISLPSLRLDSFSLDLLNIIKTSRKSSLTFAPEAGTQRLRDVINKNITDKNYMETLVRARRMGWQSVKLYFMMGLPTETVEDLDGIIDMVFRGQKNTGLNLHVSVSNFVPQPFTPFQWEKMDSIETLKEKALYLSRRIKNRKVRFNWHEPKVSFLEGVFTRGDRRLSPVIRRAYEAGCRFDGWSEYFNFDRWMEAFQESGINPEIFTDVIPSDAVLPWSHIDAGISEDYLSAEMNRALQGISTGNCREQCRGCGICSGDLSNCLVQPQVCERKNEKKPSVEIHQQNCKMRICMSRVGELRWISHLDIQRVMERAIRRAGIPISHTEGFHQRPRISFGLPLSLGCSSLSEWLDLILWEYMEPEELKKKLNDTLPEACRVISARIVPMETKAISSYLIKSVFDVTFPENFLFNVDRVKEEICNLMELKEIIISRKNGRKDIRKYLEDLSVVGGGSPLRLRITTIKDQLGGVKAEEIISLLFGNVSYPAPFIERSGMYIKDKDSWVLP